MCERYNKEILLKLSYFLVLFHNRRKHITLTFSLSYTHFLNQVWLTKDVISHHRLALITHHIAFNFGLILSCPWLDNSCYILTNLPLWMLWMFFLKLLLHLSGKFNLFTTHKNVMLYRCVDPSNSLDSQRFRNSIDHNFFLLILKYLKTIHVTILGMLL